MNLPELHEGDLVVDRDYGHLYQVVVSLEGRGAALFHRSNLRPPTREELARAVAERITK